MSTALVTQERFGFTEEQISVLKATIAPNTSDDELALFMMVCQKTGLDPFSRQIYLSERRSKDPKTNQWVTKKSPETTIDGFRVIAERSGKYAGQQGPFWCGSDGDWKDVWLSDEFPAAAKVGILRSDFKEPVWGIALWCEYVQLKEDKPNYMWSKMGANQLAKCAESLGLRKAFPRDLSGMYTREEMAQSEIPAAEVQKDVAQRRIAELRASEPEHKALIVEMANELQKPLSEPPPQYANVPTRKRGTITFEALKKIREIKVELGKNSGHDALYYKALETAGVNHADELDTPQAREVYRALVKLNQKIVSDAVLKEELGSHWKRLGDERFLQILGSLGWSNLDEAIENSNGEQTQNLLRELRDA